MRRSLLSDSRAGHRRLGEWLRIAEQEGDRRHHRRARSGAAVGGLVGRANGSTAKGAIIGAAVGGTAGAVIGHQMDQQAKEIKQNIPGAVVERVGEGLQVTFESGLLFDSTPTCCATRRARISRRSRRAWRSTRTRIS